MKELLRNKDMLKILTGSVVFVLLYLLLFVFPSLHNIASIKKSIPQKEAELKEMKALSDEYAAVKGTQRNDTAVQDESIFSLVERIAKSRKLSEKISSMSPASTVEKENYREVGVEMKMKDMTLQNLVDYLYILEGPPYKLNIKEIQITPQKERFYMDVDLTVTRLEKK